jgi:hypothetical protein
MLLRSPQNKEYLRIVLKASKKVEKREDTEATEKIGMKEH